MKLELLETGRARDIYTLVIDNRDATRGYIEGLQKDSQRSLAVKLRRIAEFGWAGYDDQVARHLKGSRIACELKEHKSNTRLYFFMHDKRLVVCTHGGPKPGRRGIADEIAKVERLYEDCRREGLLT